jgi:uncharacterized repeat protein (TIGR03803 family)
MRSECCRQVLARLLFCLALLAPGVGRAQTAQFAALTTFHGDPVARAPISGLCQASDGNFYGTAFFGGQYGPGIIYRVMPTGVMSVVFAFAGGSTGYYPTGRPIQASDGYLYGTTGWGGTYDSGVFYRLSLTGAYTVLHSFNSNVEGAQPWSSPIPASDGNLYGVTTVGGANGMGTVYKITTSGTLTLLHTFAGSDGNGPWGELIQGSDGNLYGTTRYGGTNGLGTVFKMTPGGTLTILHSFAGGAEGQWPIGGVIQASDGSLFGGTLNGGPASAGTLFQIKTNGAFVTRYSFGSNDGSGPNGLIQGQDGNFYGATIWGGSDDGDGTVFQFTPAGVLTTLHAFSGSDGSVLQSTPVQGSDGNLYGVASRGGAHYHGAIYKVTTAGKFTGLYAFPGSSDGETLSPSLMIAKDGNLYGTAHWNGGDFDSGNVYRVTPTGTKTILHSFAFMHGYGNNEEGAYPNSLLQAKDGYLYGTTTQGGNYAAGTIFKISTGGQLTVLHHFQSTEGSSSLAGLIQDSGGTFYGTAQWGGANSLGVVFKMTSTGTVTVLHAFAGGKEGANPAASLLLASDGRLYGTTQYGGANNQGTVFKLTTSGQMTLLHSFTGQNGDGAQPIAALIQATDGGLYGTTIGGGANNLGVVFKITTGGTYKTLYSFTGQTDGQYPHARLYQASDGYLYGGAYTGGRIGNGVLFRLSTSGSFTLLYSMGDPDGYKALDLTEGPDGNMYGNTEHGGGSNASLGVGTGVVYELKTLLPLLTSFSPTSGGVGSKVTLNGVNFTDTTSVRFNGKSATFSVTSDSKLVATVPAGATTGPITIITSNGSIASTSSFTVIPAPTITSFTPTSGAVGTSVTLTGTNFTGATAVKFNGTAATFAVASATQITATVPTGAKTGKITVTTRGGTGTSSSSFTVQ